jgi:3-hydroxyacyl-CoA dehydrogenase
VKRGRFTQQFVDERLKLIRTTLCYDDFAEADIVVEAVFENMAVKRQVFGELNRVCKRGAVLATNTSRLDLDGIATATSRPEAVIGTHFFSPANVMRLVEVVRGRATSKQVIATTLRLAKTLGKVAVVVGNCPGFVGNRMNIRYRREAQFLVEEGATPEAVDQALVEFGMAMGPLALGDMIGLDVLYHGRDDVRDAEEQAGLRVPPEDRLYELKRYGQKTGGGWYKYDENNRAIPDPMVLDFIRKWAADADIQQRTISTEEILERCIYAMVNEGACALDEAYAARPVDIDVIQLNGYGFPRYRGGPMWYADTVGLKRVYERVCEFHERHGRVWEPAPLLARLAQAGKTFADYQKDCATAV